MICNFVYLYILFLSLSLVLSLILFIPFFSLFLFDCLLSKNKGKEGEELGRWGRSRRWRSIKILSIKKNSQMKLPNDFVVVSQISRLPLKSHTF